MMEYSYSEKRTHLYPLVSRCKKTNIVTFAIFIPKHVLGPDPKAMKLYGFCISWRTNADTLLYVLGLKAITVTHSKTTNMGTSRSGQRANYIKSWRIELPRVLVQIWVIVYTSCTNVYMPSFLYLKTCHTNA